MFQTMINYIKEMGNLLELVSSVRESSIERHLQTELAMLPDVFGFGHLNCRRYLTYQQVMLSNLHLENPGALEELVKEGFCGSLSDQPFSAERGDLIIESTTNREVKTRGGPIQGGYSKNLSIMNKFVRNILIF